MIKLLLLSFILLLQSCISLESKRISYENPKDKITYKHKHFYDEGKKFLMECSTGYSLRWFDHITYSEITKENGYEEYKDAKSCNASVDKYENKERISRINSYFKKYPGYASDKTLVLSRKIRVGMHIDHVMLSLGYPDKINRYSDSYGETITYIYRDKILLFKYNRIHSIMES